MKTNSSFFLLNRLAFFLAILFILSIDVKTAFSQTGVIDVQSKMKIVPAGDIGMGQFQPVTSISPLVDTDNDGLSDFWEMQYFGNLNATATQDSDNDGLTNLQEYQQGLSPIVANTPPTAPTLPPITGLVGWYHAGEAYKDDLMTVKCTLTSQDTCAALRDLSGNNMHLLQTTTGKRPLYLQGALNEKPAIRFDGIDDELIKSTFTATQPVWMTVVVKINPSASSTQDMISLSDSGEGMKLQINNTNLIVKNGVSGAQIVKPVSSRYLMISTLLKSNSSSIKEGLQAIVNGGGSAVNPAFISLGSGNAKNWAALEICEVLLYNRELDYDFGDGFVVRQYLDAKYLLGLLSPLAKPPQTNIWAHYSGSNAYTDLSRTVLCSQSGVDDVLSLEDLSGNNRHATVLNAIYKPKWVADGVNGKPVWRSTNGSSDYMKVDNINIPSTSIIYVLLKSTTGTPYANAPSFQPRASYDLTDINYFYTGIDGAGGSWIGTPTGKILAQWQLLIYQFSSTGYLKINRGTSSPLAFSFSTKNLNFAMSGDMAEYLIYSGQHNPDTGDGLEVYRYFNRKYNLGFVLP